MSRSSPFYNWLIDGEEVVRAVQTKSIDVIATNRRLVILMGGNIHETFDYKYIAHTFLESKTSWTKILIIGIGLAFALIGALLGEGFWLVFWSFRVYFFGIAAIFIIGGILIGDRPNNVLVITLSGVSRDFRYELDAPIDDVRILISKISEIQAKSKL